ncbi:MAG: 30S ribosomal protein S9 [Patescibacteria group bacterium]
MEKDEKKTKAKKPVAKKTSAEKAHAPSAKAKKEPKKEESKEAPNVEVVKAPVAMARPASPDDIEVNEAEFANAEDVPGRPERYWEATGRRKTAIARVRLFTRGDKIITVNGKPHGEYFFTDVFQKLSEDSLQKMKSMARFRVSVMVSGGGLKAQAEAVRHGIARALVKFNPDFRKRLRRAGFMTRDPRMKERKKFGLKSARRAPQWAKR